MYFLTLKHLFLLILKTEKLEEAMIPLNMFSQVKNIINHFIFEVFI